MTINFLNKYYRTAHNDFFEDKQSLSKKNKAIKLVLLSRPIRQ